MKTPAAEFVLTEEHKAQILTEFRRDPNLMTIVRKVFKDPTLDGRCLQGRATRKFLAQQGEKAKTTLFERAEFIELTTEQKKLHDEKQY